MATIHHLPGGPPGLPLSLIAQAIPKLTRHELVTLIERLIDALDGQDGDPDEEEDDPAEDDDPAGLCDEDGCNVPARLRMTGPGCERLDPVLAVAMAEAMLPDAQAKLSKAEAALATIKAGSALTHKGVVYTATLGRA